MNNSLSPHEEQNLMVDVKLLEEENRRLKEQLNGYSIIFERSLDAIVIFNKSGEFVDVNEAACQLFEMEKRELIGKKMTMFLDLVPPDILMFQQSMLHKFGSFSDELLVKLRNGKVKHIEFSMKKDAFNEFDLVIMRDISARKALERERIIHEFLFKDVFNRAVDGIVIFDEFGRFIDVNPAFCMSLNLEKAKLLNLSFQQFIAKECVDDFVRLLAELKEKGTAKGELSLVRFDGTVKMFELTTTSNVYSGFYMAIMRDVTDRKNMEIKLQKSEERFRAIFEQAHEAILIWDDRGYILNANRAASRTFELPLNLLVRKNLLDFLDRGDEKVQRVFAKFRKTGEIRDELTFHMPNGEDKQLEFTMKQGAIDGYHLTIFRNVSERRKMEKELRESEQKFRSIFDHAMNGILLWGKGYRILDVNPIACEIFQATKEQLLHRPITAFIPEKARKQFDKLIQQCDRFGEAYAEMDFSNGEKQKIVEFALKKEIIPGVGMIMLRDITERKELELQLRKSDTLNVVGELAAGIAHEIRNPMTALKGFIQLLQGSIKEDYSMYFNVIMSELKRIESIITEFLVLAKPQAVQYQQNDVCKIMQDTIDLISAQAMMHNVQIVADFALHIPFIYCEPNQLKQVFINILKNAIEVMPKGGEVTVRIGQLDDSHIRISITDQGCGIPQDKIKKLGEPFYTTKERGTGLGLMVSYKIIEEHQGKIDVESEVGVGTTFHITLPIERVEREGENETGIQRV
ncbi:MULTISPECIES: PAS domain S-box protein [Parageobacillus]|jgi:two-component system, sporulation sensor kinase E|uniref:histidine kinase n=1 Tax=Parageobacillus thermoglucosidasius TaxID=1426 RepID=A0A1B7KU25_PARTM|nr:MULTISPECIES: PAS domain S-box protein [Parageobacillus]OAT73586.1 PAS domain-containing sensor histidine kinase [Parageobacillus thermoglucosidasius]BDG48288.1 sporulation kinase E [Parageobacillus sp. KH3-4]